MRKILFFIMLVLLANVASALLYTTSVKPKITTNFNETLNYSTLNSSLKSFADPDLFIPLNTTTANFRTFDWTPSVPLDNGWYYFTANAMDIVGNKQSYSEYVLVNATEFRLSWVSPVVGISSIIPFTAHLGSNLEATCWYSLTSPNGPWVPFTETGSTTHKRTFNSMGTDQPFYANCTDEFGRVSVTSLRIGYDSAPPLIQAVAQPPNVGTTIPQTKLRVDANKAVACTTDNHFSNTPRFDNNDPAKYSGYIQTNNTKQITYPSTTQPTSYTHNIQCISRAQLPATAQLTVNVSPGIFTISVLSPPQYISNPTSVPVNIQTNQLATCNYGLNGPATTNMSPQTLSFTHTATIGTSAVGSNTLNFQCTSAEDVKSASHTFVVDITPPNGTFNASICQRDKADLAFLGFDNESGIDFYNYSMTGPNLSISGTTTSSQATITNLNLTLGTSYLFTLKIFNRAGAASAPIVKSKTFDPNSTQNQECWEKNPPTIRIIENATLGGVQVTVNCSDDSGCDPTKIKWGISATNLGCNVTTLYSAPVIVSQTSKFCWEAFDIKNNVARGSKIIAVGAVSAGCANNIKDGNETDIDCGGACSGCDIGSSCRINPNCLSNYCLNGSCASSSCDDGVKNGFESDTDCGGSCLLKCGLSRACGSNLDCSSNYCAAGICATASCTDSIKNGDEGDIDCGGSCPEKCPKGSSCLVDSDCTSNTCEFGSCTELSDEDRWQRCAGDKGLDHSDREGDADNDGLGNYNECVIAKTNPLERDTDQDGYSDGYESKAGTDPNNPDSHPSFKFWNWLLFALGFIILLVGVYFTYIQKKDKKTGLYFVIVGGSAVLIFLLSYVLTSFDIVLPSFVPIVFSLGSLGTAGYFAYLKYGGKLLKAPAAVPARPAVMAPRPVAPPPARLTAEEERATKTMLEMMRKQQLEAEEERKKVFEKFGPAAKELPKPELKPIVKLIEKPKEIIPTKAALPDEFARLSEIVEAKGEFGKLEKLGAKEAKPKEVEFEKLEKITRGKEEKGLERLKPKEKRSKSSKRR